MSQWNREKIVGLDTRAVHAGDPRPRIRGALTVPIFQSSVFEHRSSEPGGYHDVIYPRLSNLPNHQALAGKLAALEGTETALVASSGMAAISATLLEVLGKGGHALAQAQLYGGTHSFLTESFERYGLGYTFVDFCEAAGWDAAVRPTTRAVYTEAITNPLMRVADHEAVVAFARRHELVSIVDATFTSPVNFRPAELGYDIVLHSATKYLNGHSDLAAGAVAGPVRWVERIHHHLNHLGGSLDPHAAFLLARGMKTLGLRVRRQNENALALARMLHDHPAVERVNHPGLEDHPEHARARRLFDGFGGMLSFIIGGGLDAARRLLDRVELPTVGPSLGGVETLIITPATTSHAGLAPDERRRLGIDDALLRVSVGIEDEADLLADFRRALEA